MKKDFGLIGHENIYIAGQLSGVEGYMESTASGLVAAMSLAYKISGKTLAFLPKTTIIGAITEYITSADAESFQPMNANFGILPELDTKIKDKHERKIEYSLRSAKSMREYKEALNGI